MVIKKNQIPKKVKLKNILKRNTEAQVKRIYILKYKMIEKKT